MSTKADDDMNFRLKEYAPKLLLLVKVLLLLVFTTVFTRLNAEVGDHSPYSTQNFMMLVLIWAAILLPRRLFETLPAKIASLVYLAAVPFLHLVLVELLMPRTRDIVMKMLYLNIVFYYLAFLFLLFLFRRHSEIAVLIGTLVSFLCGTVNCVAWAYRSLPVLPWDLYSAKTALSVASEYEFEYTYLFWYVQLTFVCIAVLGFRLRLQFHIPHPVIHWPICGMTAIALAAFVLFLQTDTVFTKFGGYRYLFTPTVYYERNGAAVGFLSTLHYLNVEKPDGYDADKVAALALPYAQSAQAAAAAADGSELPNVIVIMNEAFSDLRALCDYETNLPVTPNIDGLIENTIKGNLHVSVKGGNTANSEYEFLTGDTMAFLPAGSIPYQQHIKGVLPNLASHLKSLGYVTDGSHPYQATGWMRHKVYPWFSFDTVSFVDDFRPLYSSDLLRGYVSDETLFDYLIRQYEENEATGIDQPLFAFAVTMQNHGSYDKEYANFRPDVEVVGLEGYQRISAYLSLIRKTDAYFAQLVNYFSNVDEKTVILMFGDHQPNDNVVSKLMGNAGVDNSAAALDAENRYITPYVLWANYDIDEDAVKADMNTENISINYLSTLLCRAAGIPLSGYQTFLAELQSAYPVITGKTVMTADGQYHTTESLDALCDADKALSAYQAFAYQHLFDETNRILEFFG